MSTNSVNTLSSSYLQSILSSSLQTAGSTGTTNSAPVAAPPSDETRVSPLANLLGELQQLQQTNPAEYQQVTQQISTNLQTAAQTAQTDGNTTAANQLSQLSTDFANASTSGQLPNLQDLAQAAGGGGHHHHHYGGGNEGGTAGAAGVSNTAPLTIISNTLTAAGVTGSSAG
jgi:hypothetical protein